MSDFDWRPIGRDELAALLVECRRLSSQAVGAATIYQLERDGRQVLAVALPDGHALVVERPQRPRRRRRIDVPASPASR